MLATAMTIFALPLSIANGAPVGSPVSIIRNITVSGSNVTGLNYKDGVIWATNYGSSKVDRFDATTGAAIGSSITVGTRPVAPIEVNGHLFVPASGSNTVTDIDMATATVTRTITLGGSNISSLNYDGTYIWATSFNGAIAQRFNPTTGVVGSSIPVGSSPGTAIMANGLLYVSATGTNTVTAIDMSTATVSWTASLSNSNIASLAYDGTYIWATVFSAAKVARLNPATGALVGYTATGSNPTNIVSANGSIWVGNTGADTVTQINPSTGAVIRNISQGGSNISSLNFDGDVIWATNFNGNFVSMIDTNTGTVSSTKPTVGSRPVVTLIVDNNVSAHPAAVQSLRFLALHRRQRLQLRQPPPQLWRRQPHLSRLQPLRRQQLLYQTHLQLLHQQQSQRLRHKKLTLLTQSKLRHLSHGRHRAPLRQVLRLRRQQQLQFLKLPMLIRVRPQSWSMELKQLRQSLEAIIS
jgi:YVTN family beta-propeller protein